jgi:hypothetical protein
VQFQSPSGPGLEHIRDDGFECSEEGAKERENEPPEGEVVVSVGCEADSGNNGYESEYFLDGHMGADHDPC